MQRKQEIPFLLKANDVATVPWFICRIDIKWECTFWCSFSNQNGITITNINKTQFRLSSIYCYSFMLFV